MEEAWHTPLNALIQVLCQVVEHHFWACMLGMTRQKDPPHCVS